MYVFSFEYMYVCVLSVYVIVFILYNMTNKWQAKTTAILLLWKIHIFKKELSSKGYSE